MRFLAFFFVFCHHFIYRGGNSLNLSRTQSHKIAIIDSISFFGAQGVTIFFFLSSFLISKILLKELSKDGKIWIKDFYIRRILRIWPLYYSFVFVFYFAKIWMASQAIESDELPFMASFTYNWHQIFSGESRGMGAILWSISVEEQIYLLLPFLLIISRNLSKRNLMLIMIVLGAIFRFIFFALNLSFERSTLSYFGVVGLGIYFASEESNISEKYLKLKSYVRFSILLIFVTYIIFYKFLISVNLFGVILFDFPALLGVWLCISKGKSKDDHKIRLDEKILAYLGRRTYGMYLFHWPILGLLVSRKFLYEDNRGITLAGVILGFFICLFVSVISYKFFETPFLNLRKRFQHNLIN